MIKYELRFWDRTNRRMIYGAGISPNQLPIIQHGDGRLEELRGEFVPMINTGQKAVGRVDIWEADIIECDVPAFVIEGMPVSYVKARGVMQFNQRQGSFTVNIQGNPQMAGEQFAVTNSRVIGDVFSQPELLKANPNENDKNKSSEASATEAQSNGERA